ncbi:MAG: aminomethyl-transferring glycine dehydrogenase subunit GcvPA [bacterium]
MSRPSSHSYLSNLDPEREQLRNNLNIEGIDELERDIPEELKNEFTPDTGPRSESEVLDWHIENSSRNRSVDELDCFLGGGLYDHFVPSTVLQMMNRGEFLTSYTPYQAEINQGTLQGMFEFQSMVSELMGLPVTNASMYDGATAFAEAVLMAINHTDRDRVYYSPNLQSSWIEVLKTYSEPLPWEIIELPSEGGCARFPDDWGEQPPAAVCMGYPNRWGCADLVHEWEEHCPDEKTVGIAGVNPLAMALLEPPGKLGWDVSVGEGQPLGLPLSGGAPQLGLFSAREEFIRKMPGRLVGETEDRNGSRCYVLTLQTREQHIRRERATSNICTNHALLTLGVAVFLATMGPDGLRERARTNYRLGRVLEQVFERNGFTVKGDPVFNEVAVELDEDINDLNAHLESAGYMGGFESDGYYICAVTERRDRQQIEDFVQQVKQYVH